MSAALRVNDPEALAELTAAFAAYERALVGNDIAALNAMFWDSPLTLRYGTRAHELSYSHAEIAEFRQKRGAVDQRRTLRNTRIVTFGTDFGVANTAYVPAGSDRIGRQSAKVPRRLNRSDGRPARAARENESSSEPERGGRYRRLHPLAGALKSTSRQAIILICINAGQETTQHGPRQPECDPRIGGGRNFRAPQECTSRAMLSPGGLATLRRGVGEGNVVAVTNLFAKRAHGTPVEAVDAFAFGPQGITTGVCCSPLRHVLITSRSITAQCGLGPGDLRENIEVDVDDLYDLPSGSVVRLGEALIRLTFHCEPCRKIMHLATFDDIVHKRGYLGCLLNSGRISRGDAVTVTGQKLESIPYAVKDRIRWFFAKQNAALGALDLVHALGLPSSSARIVPRLVANIGVRWR